jgi:hypothetical protein
VSDWIDDLKRKTKEQEDNKLRQEEIRLHKSKIIKGRLPMFWQVLMQRIQVDCLKLKETFPNENQYHCHMEATGNGFKLTGGKLPFHILEVEVNLDGQCIDIFESTKNDRFSEPVPGRATQIGIDVTNDEDLMLQYKEKVHTVPETLSQQLISLVLACGIKI